MISLFLSDFRAFVRNKAFNSETNEHPVFYYESDEVIYFYKPIGSIIYVTEVSTLELPENLNIEGLKTEFDAIEVPKLLEPPKQITGTLY